MITIRLPVETEKRLITLAKQAGQTKTAIAREAILEYIEDIEDYHTAEKRMHRIHSGRENTYTLEEMEVRLGLK